MPGRHSIRYCYRYHSYAAPEETGRHSRFSMMGMAWYASCALCV
ncbi:MAG: hypothetical protein OJF49_004632 [Ktedonobacterales bacterium]|nr:MAG: hypothetical protein OJF49_004632 [Ktedonobacterales bacterium]